MTLRVAQMGPASTEALVRDETHRDPEALFREARRRRRRRWTMGVLLLAVAVIVAALLAGRSSGPSHPHTRPHGGLAEWSAPLTSNGPPPSVYVAGDGTGGIGVYSTATGKLLRTLSPQGGGGPDQQAVLGADGKSVYFAQPDGACNGTIQRVLMSGASPPATAISVPRTLALEPSPSPTSNELAWVGVTCDSGVTSSSLYVTNQTTGVVAMMGSYSGRNSDDGIAWSRDGKLLAVENGPTVQVVPDGKSTNAGKALRVPTGCSLSDPAFVPTDNHVAVARTCYSTKGLLISSAVLVYDSTTGRPVARVVEATAQGTIQSISVDPTGHVLVGFSTGFGDAELSRVSHGRLVMISTSTPTGAQW